MYQFAGALIDASPDGVIVVDADGIIQLANPVASTLFGRSIDDLTGTCVDELVPTEFRPRHEAHRRGYHDHATKRPMGTGLRLFAQNASGTMFPVEISLSPVRIDGQQHTIATIRDVSDRQETETRMAMLQDRERIARDIHDMVIQRLFAAGMSLQAVQPQAQPAVVADRIADTIEELDDTIRELRQAIFHLSQDNEPRTVESRIRELVGDRTKHLGFTPDLDVGGDLDGLPDFVSDQLIATITEALSNIARHAGATTASISIDHTGGHLSLVVRDDGKGLPPEPKRSGGLSNMMWRAAELGGSCTIGRNEPRGTRLHWSVPA
jgi:PAS domain S-box-containing protein